MDKFNKLYESIMSEGEENPKFKKWFKGSKVVDAQGNPEVVYHGSPVGGFDTFDIEKTSNTSLMQKQGPGFYFTDKKNASTYTKAINKSSSRSDKSGLYDVYLSIKKPLMISQRSRNITLEQTIKLFQNGDDKWFYTNWVAFDKSGALYKDKRFTKDEINALSDKEKGELYGTLTHKGQYGDLEILENIHRAYEDKTIMLKQMRKIFKADGIIFKDNIGYIYVAWEPTQIKSASDNNGDFSTSNKSIYK